MNEHRPTRRPGLATRAVHSGERRWLGSLTTPIVLSSSYWFEDCAEVAAYTSGRKPHYEYGRYGNPTREAAERKLADLEGAEECVLTDCGMSAVAAVMLATSRQGDHIIITDDAYKKSLQMTETVLKRFGIRTTVVPMGDYRAMEDAIEKSTTLIISESPTNPYLNVADLEEVARIGRRHGITTAIDSTFATPYNQNPLEFGIDIVIHSGTKYLAGHNDVLCGAVIGPAERIRPIRDWQGTVGGLADPVSAFLLMRGLKTFVPRLERQNATAMAVAQFLQTHPKVRRTYYPGLPSHRHYEIARRQMRGFGGVVTFELDATLEQTLAFLDALELCLLAPSLGGPETLITHPATVSYYRETREERLRLGILDELVRLAVGLEDVEDIIADLRRGLDAI